MAERSTVPIGVPRLYQRSLLVAVLVHHQRSGSAGCMCGWSPLGASHAEHVADIYEAALGGPSRRWSGTVTYDEDTLVKVRRALLKTGLALYQIDDAITNMQNEGILFRERLADDE